MMVVVRVRNVRGHELSQIDRGVYVRAYVTM